MNEWRCSGPHGPEERPGQALLHGADDPHQARAASVLLHGHRRARTMRTPFSYDENCALEAPGRSPSPEKSGGGYHSGGAEVKRLNNGNGNRSGEPPNELEDRRQNQGSRR